MSVETTNGVSSSTPINVYLYAGDQIIENVTMGYFYFQDSPGNTSHVTNEAGTVLERYTYSPFGTPSFFDAAGHSRTASNYGIRHLFHGQLWTQETGLIDHRHRQALPAMGIFIQPDPIRFAGDPTNLYRYCGNNSVNWHDPFGLQVPYKTETGAVISNGEIPYDAPSGWDLNDTQPGMDNFTQQLLNGGSGGAGSGPGVVFGPSLGSGLNLGGPGSPLGGGDKGGLFGPAAGGNGLGLSNVDAHGGDGGGGNLAHAVNSTTAGVAGIGISTMPAWLAGSTSIAQSTLWVLALPFLLTGDSGPQMRTLYHYSAVSFTGGVWPQSYYTSVPGLTSQQASAGLGIFPPLYQYTVQVPNGSLQYRGPVAPNRYGPGGLPEYFSPSPGVIIKVDLVPKDP